MGPPASALAPPRDVGGEARQLTAFTDDCGDVTWSPDGRRIAFSRSTTFPTSDIFIMNLDGSGTTPLVQGLVFNGEPVWSPDGCRIAFRSVTSGESGPEGRISIINADGTGLYQLTPDVGPNDFAWDDGASWSPDGSTIVFSGAPTLYHEEVTDGLTWPRLLTIPANGGETTPITPERERCGRVGQVGVVRVQCQLGVGERRRIIDADLLEVPSPLLPGRLEPEVIERLHAGRSHYVIGAARRVVALPIALLIGAVVGARTAGIRRPRLRHAARRECRRGEDGHWCERRFAASVPLAPWHPVTCVNWYEAEAYCRWARRRLPAEAEWEWAASGEPGAGTRERRFPWGDDPPTDSRPFARDWQAALGLEWRSNTSGEFAAFLRSEVQKWAKAVQDSGAKAD